MQASINPLQVCLQQRYSTEQDYTLPVHNVLSSTISSKLKLSWWTIAMISLPIIESANIQLDCKLYQIIYKDKIWVMM